MQHFSSYCTKSSAYCTELKSQFTRTMFALIGQKYGSHFVIQMQFKIEYNDDIIVGFEAGIA